ncbi:MAG TPA: cell division protein FtsL [Burkholderiaceae bacterium]|jgi:cell division protein FtsL|nr:cell division protein FtsL [Burkholderiaceae bacterium]
MARLNLVLALLLILSGLYLVRVSYDSRRLYAEIENGRGLEQQLEADRRRLEAERQAQATHLRVERVAHDKLAMRAATPANTTYVSDDSPASAPPASIPANAGGTP